MIRHTYTIKVVQVDPEDIGPIIEAIQKVGWTIELEQDGTWDDNA